MSEGRKESTSGRPCYAVTDYTTYLSLVRTGMLGTSVLCMGLIAGASLVAQRADEGELHVLCREAAPESTLMQLRIIGIQGDLGFEVPADACADCVKIIPDESLAQMRTFLSRYDQVIVIGGECRAIFVNPAGAAPEPDYAYA